MDKHSVEQFYFEDAALAEKAAKEAETIRYIRMKTDFSKPEAIWKLYTKLLENQMFVTPVGFAFLAELYELLRASNRVPEGDIPKIYVMSPEAGKGAVPEADKTKPDSSAAKNMGSKEQQGEQTEESREESNRELILDEETERLVFEEVRKRTKSLQETNERKLERIRDGYKLKSRNTKVVIVFLALIIAGLLAMVYFSDVSPFVDAETKVIDKYSAWEETLKQKESELQERERALEQQEQ